MNDSNKTNDNLQASPIQSDMGSEEDELDYEGKEQDLTSELLSITDEDLNVDTNNNNEHALNLNTPVTTYFNNFIAYDQYKQNMRSKNEINPVSLSKNPSSFRGNNCYKY